MNRREKVLVFGMLFCLLVCVGCGGRSPAAQFYNLSPLSPPPDGVSATSGILLLVGPVTLPEALTQPQILIRQTPQRLERAEYHRWANPLKEEIPRVIGENLARDLDGRFVLFPRSVKAPHWVIQLEIDRFDGAPLGEAELWARWTLRSSDRKTIDRGQVVLRRPVEGGGIEDLVMAQTLLLGDLSRQLAERLRTLQPAS